VQVIQAKQALTPQGWRADLRVGIAADGRIAAVAPDDVATETVDVLLPAPMNLHSHAFQRAMAGLTEARGPDAGDSFWTWRRLMYRFLEQLTPDDVEAIASLVFMEMLEAGFGAVAEFHYLHHDAHGVPYENLGELAMRIVAAAQHVGVGLTLLPVLYEFGGCDGRPLHGGQRRFGNGIDQFQKLHAAAAKLISEGPDDFQMGVAPHSLRAVSPEALRELTRTHTNGPFHIHAAEQTAEVDEVVEHLGARPLEWLLGNHDVDHRWCLIHCTQTIETEIAALAASGAVAGLCPLTEASLGDGIFDGTGFLGAGGLIGVGSDSNIQVSLLEELKTLEYSQRLRDRTRAALATNAHSTGRVLFDAATVGGAQAGGRATGKIAPGAWADLIALETDNKYLCNRKGDRLLDSVIFGGGATAIREVWSAGRHVVRDGRHFARDAVEERFKATLRRLETEI